MRSLFTFSCNIARFFMFTLTSVIFYMCCLTYFDSALKCVHTALPLETLLHPPIPCFLITWQSSGS